MGRAGEPGRVNSLSLTDPAFTKLSSARCLPPRRCCFPLITSHTQLSTQQPPRIRFGRTPPGPPTPKSERCARILPTINGWRANRILPRGTVNTSDSSKQSLTAEPRADRFSPVSNSYAATPQPQTQSRRTPTDAGQSHPLNIDERFFEQRNIQTNNLRVSSTLSAAIASIERAM